MLGTILSVVLGGAFGYLLGGLDAKPARAAIRQRALPIVLGALGGLALAQSGLLGAMPAWAEAVTQVNTPAQFEAALAEHPGEIVVVDFFATWCPPCRRAVPQLNSLAESGVPVLTVDVDLLPDLAARYDVEALPTTLLLRDGQVVAREEGYRTTREYQALVETARP